VCGLFPDKTVPSDVSLLACGTSTPDQLLPSHASMMDGENSHKEVDTLSYETVCSTL
jgi:hypothetical protein